MFPLLLHHLDQHRNLAEAARWQEDWLLALITDTGTIVLPALHPLVSVNILPEQTASCGQAIRVSTSSHLDLVMTKL